MGTPKPLASLSSGLLARKGQARPAMRSQGFSGFGPFAGAVDDLGWNDMGHEDMGHDDVRHEPAVARPFTPQLAIDPAPVPPVLGDRAALQEEFEAEASEPEPASIVEQLSAPKRPKAATPPPAAPVSRVASARGKAAFTLRLDEHRHLRLRLASALKHQSAQQLVTAALDAFLDQLPEVDDMAARLAAGNGQA
ncbi:hypothetical protein ACLB0R_14535 [Sphingomonas sp. GlSt437]|uniref:hypothetical protein n=1 Tax=Sphingomonas sp. GlSt437 TaxID=3389970 RepID=UPI003A840F80